MPYIGNTNTTQAFTPAVDFFNGNGSTTAFTLSRPVASVAQVQAVIENVPQNPGDAFTVSGNTITFTSAPPSGTSNIYVYYTSPITQVIAPGQGTVSTTALADNSVTTAKIAAGAVIPADLSTGAPSWDTSNRLLFAGATSTYGAVTFCGAKNGWGGINFNSTAGTNIGTLMVADGFGGFYNSADNAWLGYFTSTSLVLGGGQTLTPSGSAPLYACRAWVNFNGTGTVAIRASGNVSSITDNGTGDYTVNFSTAMPDANYSASQAAGDATLNGRQSFGFQATPTTTTYRVLTTTFGGANFDASYVTVTIFR